VGTVTKVDPSRAVGIFVVYCLIFGSMVYGVKYVYFSHQSYSEMVVAILMMVVFYLKQSKTGYKPPQHLEEIED
jgi:hypothetical protein